LFCILGRLLNIGNSFCRCLVLEGLGDWDEKGMESVLLTTLIILLSHSCMSARDFLIADKLIL
jgi:hypothetical protein